MKFSERWLREWVDAPVDTDALCLQLTMAGLEVDAAAPAAPDLGSVVVGRIQTAEPLPTAQHLQRCSVDCGAHGVRTVVCGAPGAAAGVTAPLALPGARLPWNTLITETELHGEPSQGMLCSAAELGLGEVGEDLLVLDSSATPGTSLAEHLCLDDRVIEIDLTPNRGDCLSLLGVARETAVWNRMDLQRPDCTAVAADHDQRLDVSIEDPRQCPVYSGRVITGVDVAAHTPDWLRERLRRSGIRPISVLVDITNYVMLELGQPMHAFDRQRLHSGIRVRQAATGESLRLLDASEVALDPSTLVIADERGPVAMAGVMGGAETAVSSATGDVFLESACFAPLAVAGQGRRYRLHSESLHRFERGVDPALPPLAIERATALILACAGGRCGPTTTAGPPATAGKPIFLRRARLQRLLGTKIADSDIVEILERLEMVLEEDADSNGWQVSPPSHRYDIALEADLIEEIARIHGYDQLPERTRPVFASAAANTESRRPWAQIRETLLQHGYDEAVTFGFVDAKLQQRLAPDIQALDLDNPIAAPYAQMRTTLWSSLLPCWWYNLRRQRARIRLFECGLRFHRGAAGTVVETPTVAGVAYGSAAPTHWDRDQREMDLFDVKGDVERLFGRRARQLRFRREPHPALHPGRCARVYLGRRAAGWLGQLHPLFKLDFDVKTMPYIFELDENIITESMLPRPVPVSEFPEVRRDLALIVPEGVAAGALIAAIERADEPALQAIELFDVFRGGDLEPGFKSVALGLIFQDKTSTLITGDVDRTIGRVMERLQAEYGARLRG